MQKCLYKYISNKRRAKENLYHLLDAGGNIKDKEKAEVLGVFFASAFKNRTVALRIPKPCARIQRAE